ncbi:hypothetical protein K435DRAFT_795476 [Dendrothele bispora CBS 962.96]|uniref:Uncharacterized protein n=1 Tax=Dendrothele bispora (strain CBS 962.96) TaxID=1314807 RepID=A0A4S8M9B8_DENBC|nr:hypothetical protein K435DRAFT_795476 [Dendrothele bispora CBS 962.96]
MSTSNSSWVNLGVSKPPVVNARLLKPQEHVHLNKTEFDNVIKAHILSSDWEEIVTDTMDTTCLDDIKDRFFENFWNTISLLNGLLKDTAGHHSDESLKVLLQQNISNEFALFLHEKKIPKSLAFKDWVEKATALDVDFRHFERPKLDRIAQLESKLAEASKRSALSSHYDNSNPPRSSQSTNAFGVLSMEKVKSDPSQFDIYMKGEICRKCRNWKAGHLTAECNGDKPVLSVPYRPLISDDLKFVLDFFVKYWKPLTMDAVLARKYVPVAAVTTSLPESPVNNVDAFLSNNASSSVTALMGGLPIAHVRSCPNVYSNSHPSSPPHRHSSKFNNDYHCDPSLIRKGHSRCISPVAAIIEDADDDDADHSDGLPGVQLRNAYRAQQPLLKWWEWQTDSRDM